MKASGEWFGKWFDSPYYHILYKHRDHDEARNFIDNLHRLLAFNPRQYILDLACGKGRHAIYLNSLGMNVVGIDLSPQNIAYARQFENPRLKFHQHDMREVFARDQFHVVLNLFTSFGYFNTEAENSKAICAASKALKAGGHLVIDYLNPHQVIDQLVPREIQRLEGIEFQINRRYENGFIVKDIRFHDQGEDYHYMEKVRAIRKFEFMRYFVKAGLKLKGNYGDHSLNPYQWASSERMIFVLVKL